MKIKLKFMQGPLEGKRIIIKSCKNLIFGRSQEAKIKLGGKGVAPLHCALTIFPHYEFFLKDLGSEMGTFVERDAHFESIDQVYLQNGDCMKIGEHVMRLTWQAPVEGAESHKRSQTEKIDLKNFGRYRILGEIGHGGMGQVYRAYDPVLEREVALKIILAQSRDKKGIKRFLREAKATARLSHPHIIDVHDIGNHEGRNFFTMDLVDGANLDEMLKEHSLEIDRLVEILIKVGNAVHYAHGKNIIHRDIKPANIMIDSSLEPRVMDFGLAKIIQHEDQLSKTGEILGTPNYMAPEQFQGGRIDARTDVYALCAVLYQALVSRPPFQGETYWNIYCQVLQSPPDRPRSINPQIPLELEAICLKGLEKKPGLRYRTAKDFARDLQNFRENRPVTARPITVFIRMWKFALRHRAALVVTLLVLVGIAVAGSTFLMQRKRLAQAEKQWDKERKEECEQVSDTFDQYLHTVELILRELESTPDVKAMYTLRQRGFALIVQKYNDALLATRQTQSKHETRIEKLWTKKQVDNFRELIEQVDDLDDSMHLLNPLLMHIKKKIVTTEDVAATRELEKKLRSKHKRLKHEAHTFIEKLGY